MDSRTLPYMWSFGIMLYDIVIKNVIDEIDILSTNVQHKLFIRQKKAKKKSQL